jgi:hypothetical protein
LLFRVIHNYRAEDNRENEEKEEKEVLALLERLGTVIELVKKMKNELEHVRYELKKKKHIKDFSQFQNIEIP